MQSANPTVFIVDDDDAVRDSLSLLLELDGLSVEAYTSIEEFTRHYQRPSCGCLILDQHLPVTSGLDFLTSAAGRQLGLPVMMLTGRGDDALRAKAKEAGAAIVLDKPIAEDLLMTTVDRLISASRLEGSKPSA